MKVLPTVVSPPTIAQSMLVRFTPLSDSRSGSIETHLSPPQSGILRSWSSLGVELWTPTETPRLTWLYSPFVKSSGRNCCILSARLVRTSQSSWFSSFITVHQCLRIWMRLSLSSKKSLIEAQKTFRLTPSRCAARLKLLACFSAFLVKYLGDVLPHSALWYLLSITSA